MECDGLKKAVMVDNDGGFLGSSGSVVSQAEFQWGVNGPRGLGNFRIPKTMLLTADNQRLDPDKIYPHKGNIVLFVSLTSVYHHLLLYYITK